MIGLRYLKVLCSIDWIKLSIWQKIRDRHTDMSDPANRNNDHNDNDHNRGAKAVLVFLSVPDGLKQKGVKAIGSINTKNGKEVQILQKWNDKRPNIALMLGSFMTWLLKNEITGRSKFTKAANS